MKIRVFKTRNKAILYSAMFAMFTGAMLLSMSERTISSAGAFSLSDYYDLNSIDSVIDSQSHSPKTNWSRIETENIYIGNSGNIPAIIISHLMRMFFMELIRDFFWP